MVYKIEGIRLLRDAEGAKKYLKNQNSQIPFRTSLGSALC